MKLKNWMDKNKLDSLTLAFKLKCSFSTIYKWRSGAFKPSNAYMEKIYDLTNGEVTREDFEGGK